MFVCSKPRGQPVGITTVKYYNSEPQTEQQQHSNSESQSVSAHRMIF